MNIFIHQATENDYPAIEKLVEIAFQNAPHSDHNEHILVAKLRQNADFIPALSLCAKNEQGQIIGYVLLSKIMVGNQNELALAPIAVLPEYQGQGVGKALILHAHAVAKSLGFSYSILLGDPNYYQKLGYQNASKFGIVSPFDVPDEYFMAYPLYSPPKKIAGIVVYPPEFGV